MNDEHALNEVVAAALILILVIALAALVFVLSTGMLSNLTKPTFISPKISAQTISGKNVIDIFNQGGDVIYLDVPRLQYNEMGVYIDTPSGSFRAQPLPGVDQFSPGTNLYIFKGPDKYQITDKTADLSLPKAQSIPDGQVGVRLVDETSQTLLAKWAGAAGISPTPTQPPSPAPVKAAFIREPAQGIVPLTVRFIDSSSGPVTSWFWTFGDDTTSAEQNPSHTYSEIGEYAVSLKVTNTTGGFESMTWPGCIRVIIQADFSAAPLSGPSPLVVQFTDATVRNADTWKWDFGDGDTTNSSQKNPVHTFKNPGTYTIKLTTSHAGMTDTAIKTGYIAVQEIPRPVASFVGTPTFGEVPLTVVFSDTSTNHPTAWSWDFGDGDTTNNSLQNPAHTYAKAGSYTVGLQSSNAGGRSDLFTRSDYISVSGSPSPLTISWVWPDNLRRGQEHKDVDAAGTGFVESGMTRVTLRHSGEKDIEGEWVKVLRPTHLIFDIKIPNSAMLGDWDVIVTNPDSSTCTLKDGFEVRN